MRKYENIWNAIEICYQKINELEKMELTNAVLEDLKFYNKELNILENALSNMISRDNIREIMG